MQHVNWNIIRIPTFHFVSKVSQHHNQQCTGPSSMRTKTSGSPCCITKRKAMRRCDGRCGDAMDDEAMRWTMRRCDGRCGDAMGAMRWGYVTIAPSHRLIVHRIASSSIASPHRPSHRPIASPHRPSHRLIVHRIASSSIASPHRPSHRLIVIASPQRQCEPSRPSYHTVPADVKEW